MDLSIPGLSLVVLIGVTGSGKSTFARAHFKPTEVISSDFCRGLVTDDENDQSATAAAFEEPGEGRDEAVSDTHRPTVVAAFARESYRPGQPARLVITDKAPDVTMQIVLAEISSA